jgi:hypothetical protein
MNRREFIHETGTLAIAVAAAGGCINMGEAAAAKGRGGRVSGGVPDLPPSWQLAMPLALPIGCPGTWTAVHPQPHDSRHRRFYQ